MIQIGEYQEVLYELDTRLLIINKTDMSAMQTVSYLRYTITILTDVHTGVTHLTSGTLSLKGNVDTLYDILEC